MPGGECLRLRVLDLRCHSVLRVAIFPSRCVIQCFHRCARALRAAGVGKGDRVAGVMVNSEEALVCMLGATAIGAIWRCVLSFDVFFYSGPVFQGQLGATFEVGEKWPSCPSGALTSGHRPECCDSTSYKPLSIYPSFLALVRVMYGAPKGMARPVRYSNKTLLCRQTAIQYGGYVLRYPYFMHPVQARVPCCALRRPTASGNAS